MKIKAISTEYRSRQYIFCRNVRLLHSFHVNCHWHSSSKWWLPWWGLLVMSVLSPLPVLECIGTVYYQWYCCQWCINGINYYCRFNPHFYNRSTKPIFNNNKNYNNLLFIAKIIHSIAKSSVTSGYEFVEHIIAIMYCINNAVLWDLKRE